MRTWDPLPPGLQFKAYLSQEQREPARREHWCAVCGAKINAGDDMQFVRWSAAEPDYTALHGRCWDDLPEAEAPAALAEPNRDGQRRVYASGQRERANGATEVLTLLGFDARMVKLPDGERHLGARYAVFVNDGPRQLTFEGS